MPLLDHFHPPASARAPWPSLGTVWVGRVMGYLNRVLPGDRYAAVSTVHLGSQAEADIGEFEVPGDWNSDPTSGLVVVPPVVTIEAVLDDEFEVEVRDTHEGMALVGVIEFISPANKDRPEARQRLAAKTMAYLDLGVGVILVDIITSRRANLHNEIVAALKSPDAARLPDVATYLAGYRPTRVYDRWTIDMWPYAALVGDPLPAVPLALKGGPVVPVDFETTYRESLVEHRL